MALASSIKSPKASRSPTSRRRILLSFGVARAATLNAHRIYIGVNALDYSGYRDCRPDYIQATQEVFRLGTKQGRESEAISISTPLIELNNTEIIKLGNNWRVPSEKTWSCYPDG